MKKLRTRNHKVVLNRSKGGDGAITVMLAIMGFFMVLPLVYTISQSLKPLTELFIFPPRFLPIKPTLVNFKNLFYLMNFSWVPFSRYIFNTVFITVAGVFGNLLLASLAAYAIAKIEFPGRNFCFQVIQKSLMIGAAIGGEITYIIIAKAHLMDTYWALLLPAIAGPTGLYLMKQFMDTNVTTAILESARLDGAKEFRIFWSIAMPMVKPAWLTLIMTSFQGYWQMGSSTYIYSEQLKTINYAIGQITSVGVTRQGVAAAGTVFIMIVPIIIFIVSQSNIIETMGSSGMKD
ncbi:MAG: carbohydrate ABC transporter permease [Clostridia bacterium]|nr:carbohydrate ABC transporter permease [Clostridia bacterium]